MHFWVAFAIVFRNLQIAGNKKWNKSSWTPLKFETSSHTIEYFFLCVKRCGCIRQTQLKANDYFMFISNKYKSQTSVLALAMDVWQSSPSCWNIQFRACAELGTCRREHVAWGWLRTERRCTPWCHCDSQVGVSRIRGVSDLRFFQTWMKSPQKTRHNCLSAKGIFCCMEWSRWKPTCEINSSPRRLSVREALSNAHAERPCAKKPLGGAWHILENVVVNACLDSRSSRHATSSPAWRAFPAVPEEVKTCACACRPRTDGWRARTSF